MQYIMLDTKIYPKVQRPDDWRFELYDLSISKEFDKFITFLVGLNTIALCIEYYGAPEWYN